MPTGLIDLGRFEVLDRFEVLGKFEVLDKFEVLGKFEVIGRFEGVFPDKLDLFMHAPDIPDAVVRVDLLLGIPMEMHCSNKACSDSTEPTDSTLKDEEESWRERETFNLAGFVEEEPGLEVESSRFELVFALGVFLEINLLN